MLRTQCGPMATSCPQTPPGLSASPQPWPVPCCALSRTTQAWLTQATASCQGGPLWSASTAFATTAVLSTNMTGAVARTPYSIGYALTSVVR